MSALLVRVQAGGVLWWMSTPEGKGRGLIGKGKEEN